MTLFILCMVGALWALAILIRERPFSRKRWMRKIKVGDTVCDCRYKHSKVISIDHVDRYPWRWVTLITGYIPWKLGDVIFEFSKVACRKLGLTSIVDKRVTVEDGHSFNLLACCDPVHDHDEASHQKEIAEIDAQAEAERDGKCSS